MSFIKIRGARQHNLKNISLDIPKNKLVVITGISGSGKSSLAFDTIYAEGQRRYVESLSAYARQFLGIMDKPDVDLIEGLSPSISIDQKTISHNPRSTVGTITEIYDYFRLLYARVGHPHCPNCLIEIRKLSLDEIVSKMFELIKEKISQEKTEIKKFEILSPVVREKKGEFKEFFENLKVKGFNKVFIDKEYKDLNQDISLLKNNRHNIDVIIDEFNFSFFDLKKESIVDSFKKRLRTAVEQSLILSDGLVIIKELKTNYSKLFSERFACPKCNLSLPEIEPRMFSFNSPIGACEQCKGIGTIFKIDPKLVLNENLSINEGGILPFNKIFFQDTWYIRLLKKVCLDEGISLDLPIKKITEKQKQIILYGTRKTYRVYGKNRFGKETVIFESFKGVVNELERRYFDSIGDWTSAEIGKYMKEEVCYQCQGKRLKPEVLSVTINNEDIAQLSSYPIDKLYNYFLSGINQIFNDYEKEVAQSIIKEILTRLNFLKSVGLSYLTIDRKSATLSGGELQRIRLASQIGSGLTGVLYVLDEPSIGLHPKDVSALIETLKKLRDLENTVLIVEHDRETIEAADYLIELGPKAGKGGGKVVFQGELSEIKKAHTLTSLYLSNRKKIELNNRPLDRTKGELIIKGAKQFNLKNINVCFPLGNLIAVTGVSGSGKSTLITETLYPALKYYLEGYYQEEIGSFDKLDGYQYLDKVYLVDQSPIGRTPRSNPSTYVGFFDEIREIFSLTLDAKAKGFGKSRFSFNIKGGRCEKCQGAGVLKIEMQFLSDIYITCDVCKGRRYNEETLEVKFKDKTIYDVLKMTVDESTVFFKDYYKIVSKLNFLQKTGLGYIELGQPAPTLSGGESQRIKLAKELTHKSTGRTLYILDEPTTGLHFYDIEKLINSLKELTDKGNTVIVIEHNLDVIKNCQYIIDLGPEGGEKGGKVVFQGELRDIIKEKQSYTGYYLRKLKIKS